MPGYRDQLTDRIAHLSPLDIERNEVGVVMCELLADLLDAITGGVEQVPTSTQTTTCCHVRCTPAEVETPNYTSSRAAAETADKGDAVHLQEPAVPPADPDPSGNDTRDLALTNQGPPAGKPGRPAARKTAAAKKTTTPSAKKTTGK